MTDRDRNAARRPAGRPASSAPARPAPTTTPTGRRQGSPAPGSPPPTGTALRDRWWWSPTLSIVIGLVVIGYQLEPLQGSNPLWGNWVVAALGLAVAVYGGVRLLHAHRSR